MSIQKQLPVLANNYITNLADFGEQNIDSKALYPLALEAICDTIGSCNYELKNMNETASSWEFQSAVKAQGLINSWYKANSMYQSPADNFLNAVERKNFAEIQRLLDLGIDVDIRCEHEDTPLMFAAGSGRLEAARFLLEHGADVNARNDWDHTPLLLAANNGHTEIVRLLLAYNADITAQDKNGDTALASAYRENHRAIVKLLINPTQAIQLQRNMDSAREAMLIMSQRVYDTMLGSEGSEEVLKLAEKYNIPYDANYTNWLKLMNDVETYEELLAEAGEYNIDWDLSEYDPVALKQEIEEQDSYYRMERNDLYSCFAATRGLEA